MANGTMFGSLSGYKKQEYYDSHPVMYFFTPDDRYRVDIYSCYVGQADSAGFEIGFSDIEDYSQWLKGTIDRSLIIAECSPDVTSHIMTLTTCSYEFDNARCIIHGILTKVCTECDY